MHNSTFEKVFENTLKIFRSQKMLGDKFNMPKCGTKCDDSLWR